MESLTHSCQKENDIFIVNEKEWKEFRESGLLWFINQTLHVFG